MCELLSISVPTRNRASYLQELLNSIEKQVKLNRDILNSIKIYIFDNVSDDNTYDIIKSFNLDILYKKNAKNIGAALNAYQAYTAVKGRYIWVIGDDELLEEDSLSFILQLIKNYNPYYIINRSSSYKTFTEPWIFPSYLDFAQACKQHDPHLLIGHSLVSLNIILKSCFNAEFALEKMDTNYAHFYGMIKGLKTFPGLVIFPQKETVIVRAQRPSWVDGIGPKDVFKDHAIYLEWLAKEYNL